MLNLFQHLLVVIEIFYIQLLKPCHNQPDTESILKTSRIFKIIKNFSS